MAKKHPFQKCSQSKKEDSFASIMISGQILQREKHSLYGHYDINDDSDSEHACCPFIQIGIWCISQWCYTLSVDGKRLPLFKIYSFSIDLMTLQLKPTQIRVMSNEQLKCVGYVNRRNQSFQLKTCLQLRLSESVSVCSISFNCLTIQLFR